MHQPWRLLFAPRFGSRLLYSRREIDLHLRHPARCRSGRPVRSAHTCRPSTIGREITCTVRKTRRPDCRSGSSPTWLRFGRKCFRPPRPSVDWYSHLPFHCIKTSQKSRKNFIRSCCIFFFASLMPASLSLKVQRMTWRRVTRIPSGMHPAIYNPFPVARSCSQADMS